MGRQVTTRKGPHGQPATETYLPSEVPTAQASWAWKYVESRRSQQGAPTPEGEGLEAGRARGGVESLPPPWGAGSVPSEASARRGMCLPSPGCAAPLGRAKRAARRSRDEAGDLGGGARRPGGGGATRWGRNRRYGDMRKFRDTTHGPRDAHPAQACFRARRPAHHTPGVTRVTPTRGGHGKAPHPDALRMGRSPSQQMLTSQAYPSSMRTTFRPLCLRLPQLVQHLPPASSASGPPLRVRSSTP